MIRAVIVEDEPISRTQLRTLLKGFEWLNVVGEAGDGRSGLHLIESLRPDLVFLDIEMPEMNGLELLKAMPDEPDVIITTAKDRYAVAAFELEAVDYLLKPFGAERLRKAVERIHRDDRDDPPRVPGGSAARARQVLQRAPESGPLTRVFVRERGKAIQVAIAEVERLEAQDDYVALHVKGRRHLVYLPLADFAQRLDPARFVRIHRSHIVNLDFVAALASHDATRAEVQMRDGSRLLASRARTPALRQLARAHHGSRS
jgi:two-component system LytT family response regulator